MSENKNTGTTRVDSLELEKDSTEYIKEITKEIKSEGNPLERFVLVSKLGEGGSGIIYKAHDPSLGRDLAVKVLKDEFADKPLAVERFLREARASAQLEHPNIIPIHELGFSDELGCYFTMKKITGDSLEEILKQLREENKDFTEKYNLINLLEIFIKICHGVSYAHSKNIIHRDLKPENIIVGSYGEVFIIDWGLAKKIGDKTGDATSVDVKLTIGQSNYEPGQTVHGTINGTPCYMSPEQACGMQDEIGIQSDIYCLGTILYETLCYHPPFESDSIHKVLIEVAKGNFPHPSKRNPKQHISKELEAITMKAMARNPKCRYQEVGDLINDVRNAIGNYPVTAYNAPPIRKLWRMIQRHKLLTSVLFSILMGAIFSVIFFKAREAATEGATIETATKIVETAYENMEKATVYKRRIDLGDDIDNLDFFRNKYKEHELQMTAGFNTALSLYKSTKNKEAMSNGEQIFVNLINYRRNNNQPERLSVTMEMAELWTGKPVFPNLIKDKENYERLIQYIEGNGTITIAISPEPEQMVIYAIDEDSDGKFSTSNPYSIISGNCYKKTIKKGRYKAVIKTKSQKDVIYSFKIDHIGHETICFNIPDDIPYDMIFIPPGPVCIGGPRSSYNKLSRKTLRGFLIRKTEVTFGEYYQFWKSLSQLEKNRYFPYIQLSENIRQYVTAWDRDGNFRSFCDINAPVVGITHEASEAYCRWLGEKTSRKLRLPTASEWEKAARGADGRNFVWGNDLTLTNALVRGNKKAKQIYDYWAPVNSFPKDRSIYGVVDMAGNAREWTSTNFGFEDNFYLIKGGSAFTPSSFIYCESESYNSFTPSDVGFRYVEDISINSWEN